MGDIRYRWHQSSAGVCLIGVNGAGKTTLLKAIVGLLPHAAGTVQVEGASLTRKPSHEIVRHGVALVPEVRDVFSRLSVAENLDMGAGAITPKCARIWIECSTCSRASPNARPRRRYYCPANSKCSPSAAP